MADETRPLFPILITKGYPTPGACRRAGRWYIPLQTPLPSGIEMLDAFIIQRIRQEQESRRPVRQPLRIEVPQEPRPGYRGQTEPRGEGPGDTDTERGVAIIDFTI